MVEAINNLSKLWRPPAFEVRMKHFALIAVKVKYVAFTGSASVPDRRNQLQVTRNTIYNCGCCDKWIYYQQKNLY